MKATQRLLIHIGLAFAMMMLCSQGIAADAVRLYAAGSLRSVMNDIAQAFSKESSIGVQGEFGASGILRQRIEKGEPAEVFASADMGHPQALARAGRAGQVLLFTRNRLCAIARPNIKVTSETLLEKILDPAIKLGTSTPKFDPSGDYTWLAFEKAEKLKAGSYQILDKKALKLVGAPDSPPAPLNRTPYGKFLEEGAVDVFLTYCTNALLASREVPGLQTVQFPQELAVSAEYGLTVIKGARPDAEKFVQFVLSSRGQAILSEHGFAPAAP
jgi:molybdate transport system substrate-binding protein